MKKLLIVLLISVASSAWAQFLPAGSIIGTGSFSFMTEGTKDSDDKGSSFSINPAAGYLVMDNLVVGANILFSSSTSKNEEIDFSAKSNSITFGPLVRYYLEPGVFFHGLYNFGSSKSTLDYSYGEFEDKSGLSQFQIGVGYAARITDTVLFEPMIGYYSDTTKDKEADTKSTTGGLFVAGSFTIILKTGN